MNLLSVFRQRRLIATTAELADFMDRNAAFLVQKGLYEYARARAGHYAKVLFGERDFREAIERSRWQAYPLGLAMIAEMVEGVLRAHADDKRILLDALGKLALSVLDRYDAPAAIEASDWSAIRQELAHRIDLIGVHAVKPARDIPIPFAEAYFKLMPIHEKLRASEYPTITNYLRVTMCNIHDEFTRGANAAVLARDLQRS